jgi:predicted HAD superfamily Cof-like phosphohydrolase
MSVQATALWFQKAFPELKDENFQVQLGCHFEELGEMLENLLGQDKISETAIRQFEEDVKFIATAFKTKNIQAMVMPLNRQGFLDALVDQVVTATGCAHLQAMNLPAALDRVNQSNYSKFDENGNPIFDLNGKIKKGPNYKQPDLSGLY